MRDAPDIDLGACIAGDKVAWDRFVGGYAGIIQAAITRCIGGRSGAAGAVDAGDLVQDVFVRLLKEDRRLLRTFDPSRASLATWLALVARSMAIDHLRRRRTEARGLEPGGAAAVAAAPATAAEVIAPGSRECGIDRVELPWHLLTARQRLVLRMLFDRAMPVSHVAAVIGVDEQTVRTTKHKALSRLRAALDSARSAGDAGEAASVSAGKWEVP